VNQESAPHDVPELAAAAERNAVGSDSSVSDYERLDPVEVQEARLRAQQPSLYAPLRFKDLYSRPTDNH